MKTAPAALTDRQQDVLDFLVTFVAENGYPPSVREVAAAIGVKVTSANYQLGQLQEKGRIRRAPGLPRAIQILHLTPVPKEITDVA